MRKLSKHEIDYFNLMSQEVIDHDKFEQMIDEQAENDHKNRIQHDNNQSDNYCVNNIDTDDHNSNYIHNTIVNVLTQTKQEDKIDLHKLGILDNKTNKNTNLIHLNFTKLPRLFEVAKEYNIGRQTILEFLSNEGFAICSNQNFKLTEEMFKKIHINFFKHKKSNIRQINLNEYDNRKKIQPELNAEKHKISEDEFKTQYEPIPLFKCDEIVHF